MTLELINQRAVVQVVSKNTNAAQVVFSLNEGSYTILAHVSQQNSRNNRPVRPLAVASQVELNCLFPLTLVELEECNSA